MYLEKGKKYFTLPENYRELFKTSETVNEFGDTVYNMTTKIVETFNNDQEEFIVQAITRIGMEYGILFSFNKEKIADALKKRIKTEVKITDAYPHKAYCPSCYTTLNLNIEAIQNPEHLPGYCSCCGQTLDWSIYFKGKDLNELY